MYNFWIQAYATYKGLFYWLNWISYITNVFLHPVIFVLTYSILGRFALGPEAARTIIDDDMRSGRALEDIRADEAEFQRRVLQMKIDLEDRTPPSQLTFFERAIPDSIAYYRACGENPDVVISFSQRRRYKGIFILDLLPFEKDYARTAGLEPATP